MMSSKQPVVLLTGASRGIGLAAADLLLTKFNANVVALSRTKSPALLKLIQEHPKSLLSLDCDVSNEPQLVQAIDQARQTYGHIDALILNAGVVEPLGHIDHPETDTNAWRAHFEVNFFSLIVALKASLPSLRDSDLGGRVIFVSSGAAVASSTGSGPYNAAKAAMNSLCRTLAQEEPTIVAIALRPGMVDTPMQETMRNSCALLGVEHKKYMQAYEEGRLVTPEDAGHVIAALALKAPKSLSGQFLNWNSEECKDFRAH